MQPLMTIADLTNFQTKEALAPYLEEARSLHKIYFGYVLNSQNDSYEYKVELFGSKTRAQGIHASEISSCMKQLVYGIMGTERRPDPDTMDLNMLMRFRIGTAVHAMLQADWHRIAEKDPNILFEDEVTIHPDLGGACAEWNLHSSCDGVITILKGGVPYMRVGMEIKTESYQGFNGLKKPRPKHVEQTMLYMRALDLPLMWTLYYNKSNSNIVPAAPPYLFKFDDNLWSNDLEMRFARATYRASINKLPEKTEGMHCKWCPFSYTCKPTNLNKKQTAPIPRGMWSRK